MATTKSGWTTCPICNTRLKASKLEGHMKHVHPRGVRTQEERAKIVSRRQTATGATKWVAVVAIIVVIILVTYYAIIHLDLRGSNTGDKPYAFILATPTGQKYSLDDHLGDKPILLGFMSTDCAHCARMANVFHKIYDNYSNKVEIVIVISNTDATMANITDWVNTHALQFPVVFDTGGTTFNKYDLSFYPSMYIVNKASKISWTNKGTDQGEYTYEQLTAKLDKVT